jgi:hypothetical protein
MKADGLSRFYTLNPITGDYIIEIALNEYTDIFNSWDLSSHEIRDFDSELKLFLEECSNDIDLQHKIILRINVKDQYEDEKLEETIRESFRNYFNYSIILSDKILIKRRKQSGFYILLSTFFLFLTMLLQNRINDNVFLGLIFHSLTVGGWIFLWEAFSILFIQSIEPRKKRKLYKRLLLSPIMFKTKIKKISAKTKSKK